VRRHAAVQLLVVAEQRRLSQRVIGGFGHSGHRALIQSRSAPS
jgi:hypothetical protein